MNYNMTNMRKDTASISVISRAGLLSIRISELVCIFGIYISMFADMFPSYSTQLNLLFTGICLALFVTSVVTERLSFVHVFPVIIMLFLGSCTVLIQGSRSLLSISRTLLYYCIALYLIEHGISRIGARMLYVGSCLLLFVLLFTSPDGYALFNGVSRNYCSVYLIILFSITAPFIYSNKGSSSWELLIYSTIAVILSAIAQGRGGIISTLLLEVGMLLLVAHDEDNRTRKSLLTIVLVFLSLLLLLLIFSGGFNEAIEHLFSRFGSASASRSDEARMGILQSYLRSLDSSMNLIFGSNPLNIGNEEVLLAQGNLHNSVLAFHSTFGLLGITLLLICVMKCIVRSISENRYIFLITVAAFLVRSLTDWMYPLFSGDIFIYILIFYSFGIHVNGSKA